MVYKLTHDEVLNVCNACAKYVKDKELCKSDDAANPKGLKEMHHCPKWDEFFKGSCIYQG